MSARTEEDDARLAALLAEMAEEHHAGNEPDVERRAREHPDLADELRQLWAAALVAEEAATVDLAAEEASAMPTDSRTDVTGELPRTFGGYQLLEELGRGGMGVVYHAVQQSLGRKVALKRILRGEYASAADLARFRAEAESAARLDHPSILPVHEIGEVEGQLYFTMKLVEGGSLAQRLAEGMPAALQAS